MKSGKYLNSTDNYLVSLENIVYLDTDLPKLFLLNSVLFRSVMPMVASSADSATFVSVSSVSGSRPMMWAVEIEFSDGRI